MGVFSRLADIISANLNSALDRAEDPEKMIRQMIHEMEDTLVEVRSAAARSIADKKDLNRKLEALDRETGDWEDKAELAIRKAREDLAKAALVEGGGTRNCAAAQGPDRAGGGDSLRLGVQGDSGDCRQFYHHESVASGIRTRTSPPPETDPPFPEDNFEPALPDQDARLSDKDAAPSPALPGRDVSLPSLLRSRGSHVEHRDGASSGAPARLCR